MCVPFRLPCDGRYVAVGVFFPPVAFPLVALPLMGAFFFIAFVVVFLGDAISDSPF